MFAVPTIGEDIFESQRSWGYDVGMGVSRTLGKRFEIEGKFDFWFKNYKQNLILDVEKIYELQHCSSNSTQYFNNGFDDFSGEKFSLNLWYKLASEPNSWMIMLGIGANSPARTYSPYNIYIDNSLGLPDAQYLYVYYYSNPKLIFYPVLNVGLGYEYKLWRKSRLRIALQFQYSNTMYFFGQYETTSYAKFEAKGRVYYNPSELGINITYFF
ncbi:MAG: hypothetical protein DSY76_07385 [Bacteroidetes bacterium]|nr:MAG: hypothetical protein DSY76_07385 [Bacteroidota bacterium]